MFNFIYLLGILSFHNMQALIKGFICINGAEGAHSPGHLISYCLRNWGYIFSKIRLLQAVWLIKIYISWSILKAFERTIPMQLYLELLSWWNIYFRLHSSKLLERDYSDANFEVQTKAESEPISPSYLFSYVSSWENWFAQIVRSTLLNLDVCMRLFFVWIHDVYYWIKKLALSFKTIENSPIDNMSF